MKYFYALRLSFLFCVCTLFAVMYGCRKDEKDDNKPVVMPEASFTYGVNGLTVDINNTSTNTTSADWDFGDGNKRTTQPDELIIKHTFAATGTYKVLVTAKNDKGVDTFSQFITVDGKPRPNFTFETNGLEVTFRNTSGNASAYEWDFGDNSAKLNSNDTVIKHTFSSDGNYKVILKVINGNETDTFSRMVNVGILFKLISIKTDFGEMIMWLYDQTPKHKANFLKLAEEAFYDGTTFHRVISNFMIQGGDPNSKDSDPNNDGQGGPGYTIDAEIVSSLKHDFGAVGAARLSDAVNPERKSSGSQFYIVNSKTGGASHLNGQYTVFGKVIKGADITITIAQQPKNSSTNRPLSDIKMDVDIIQKTRSQIKTEFNFDIP